MAREEKLPKAQSLQSSPPNELKSEMRSSKDSIQNFDARDNIRKTSGKNSSITAITTEA